MKAEKISNVLLAVGLALAMLAVGWLSHEDAKAELAFYCEMVGAKTWPDYKGSFKKECRKDEKNIASAVDISAR